MTNLTNDMGNQSTSTYRHLPNNHATAMVENQLQLKGLDFTRNYRRLNGTKIVVSYTITNESYAKTIDGGLVRPRLYLFNSENRECAFKVAFGFLKLVCDNGMMVGDHIFSDRMVHRQGLNFETKYRQIRFSIAAALDYLETDWETEINNTLIVPVEQEAAIQIIGNLNVPAKVKTASINSLFTPRRIEDAHGSVGCLLNIVNEEIANTCDSEAAVTHYNKNLLRDILDLKEAM